MPRRPASCLLAPSLSLGALLLLAGAASSQQMLPSLERGFKPDRLYQFSDLDQVNLFSGNLTITLPLGLEYPVGDGFSYRLTLVYNSKLWDWEQHDLLDSESGLTVFDEAKVGSFSNSGFGWRLSLGELGAPLSGINDFGRWLYRSADGGDHALVDDRAGAEITNDGTYLRLRRLPGDTTAILETPSGELHTYEKYDPVNHRWRIKEIGDRFGNYVRITYFGASEWRLTDRLGRTHKVFFTLRTYDGHQRATVDRIELATFGGGPAAEYKFNYVQKSVLRGCAHTFTLPNGEYEEGVPITASVPLLVGVDLPDGTRYAAQYYEGNQAPCPMGAVDAGALEWLQLPTLGKLRYSYQLWRHPVPCRDDIVGPAQPVPLTALFEIGVATRWQLGANGGELGKWSYSQALRGGGSGICPFAGLGEWQETTVTTPLLDREVSYFSVYLGERGATHGTLPQEHALPVTRKTKNTTDGIERFLSREIFDCDAAGVNCQKVRSVFARWEGESEFAGCEGLVACGNRRQVSELVLFHDDGERYTEWRKDCFDGLGHYRFTEQRSNLPGSERHWEQTQYNPGRGVLRVDEIGNRVPGSGCGLGDYVHPGASDPWVLDTYTFEERGEGTSTERTETSFNAATGFLESVRTLKDATPGLNDVLVAYTRTPLTTGGYQIEESWRGGDTGRVDSQSPAYTLRHTVQYGSHRKSEHLEPNGSALPPSLDLDIDSSTGLASASRDTSGLVTSYSYDSIGRLRWEKPSSSHGAWIERRYNNARTATANTPASEANVVTWFWENGNTNPTTGRRRREQVVFDALGRVREERRERIDQSTWAYQSRTYTAAGQLASRSEWGSGNKTRYLEHDAFGRPRKIVLPDGHEVKLAYLGVRETSRTVKVGTSWDGINVLESEQTAVERSDHQGRLYQVVEPSGPSNGAVTTTYGYDVAGRLRTVSTSSGTVTQQRTFVYDRRGFLTSETVPERSLALLWKDYDARGHAQRQVLGSRDLRYRYDAGERLESVSVAEPEGPRLLEEWHYAASNGPNDRRRGRVERAVRHNRIDLGGRIDVPVEETYVYGGRDGRISNRTTKAWLNWPGQPSRFEIQFETGFSYSAIGDIASIDYPRCTAGAAGCGESVSPARTISSTYTNGYLAAIPGYVTSFSYHPNLALAQIKYASGVEQNHAKDPFDQARPAQIWTANMADGAYWDTGLYQYDGAGNITRIRNAWFRYDGTSRLAEAEINLGPIGLNPQKRRQSYGYDAFGNLQSITGDQGHATPTDSATNRLTAGAYDTAGNVRALGNATWDPTELDQPWRHRTKNTDGVVLEHWLSIYGPGGERLLHYDANRTDWHYAQRDLAGRVLREWVLDGAWRLDREYIYAGSRLIAAETPEGRRDLHTDHLGTVRHITDANRRMVAYHVYYPFGQEASVWNQDREQMKFTGHERDFHDPAGPGDDVDNMHARACSPIWGRFLSVDPAGGRPEAPQSWNRYAYTRDNPVRRVDPDGESDLDATNFARELAALYAESTPEQKDRFIAAQAATFTVFASFFVPGPDELLLGGVFKIAGKFATKADNLREVTVSAKRYPETAGHVQDAQAAGHPSVVTIDRTPGASDGRRAVSLKDTPPTKGKDRDEYPPAMFKEGGEGASVRTISPSDNRGAGACIGNQCRDLPNGSRVQIVVKPN